MITKELLKFLLDLRNNNDREWFNERKATFKEHEAVAKKFYQAIREKLEDTDEIQTHKIYRIYRDVRFSKDKTPFKARFSGGFSRATSALRGGYFLSIEPGKSFAGGGFYGPDAADLMRIRKEFEVDDSEIRAIVNDKKFRTTFGEMQGAEVKLAPKGFDSTHGAIDLIRKKQLYFGKQFTDKEVILPNFSDQVIETYKTIRPFFDYMSSVLTTDLNGESIL